jgi:hypothetical protein
MTKAALKVAQEICQTGIENLDLRDEIFCQLVKQTSLNANM